MTTGRVGLLRPDVVFLLVLVTVPLAVSSLEPEAPNNVGKEGMENVLSVRLCI